MLWMVRIKNIYKKKISTNNIDKKMLTDTYKIQKKPVDESKFRYRLDYAMKGKKYSMCFETKRDICLHLNCANSSINHIIKKDFKSPKLQDMCKYINIVILRPYAVKSGNKGGRPKKGMEKNKKNVDKSQEGGV